MYTLSVVWAWLLELNLKFFTSMITMWKPYTVKVIQDIPRGSSVNDNDIDTGNCDYMIDILNL